MKTNILEELKTLIGEDGLMALLETNGGFNTYIPKIYKGTKLESDIGPEYSKILSKEFGGEHLDIPIAKQFRITQFLKQGKAKRWVAQHMKCNERLVYRYSKEISK